MQNWRYKNNGRMKNTQRNERKHKTENKEMIRSHEIKTEKEKVQKQCVRNTLWLRFSSDIFVQVLLHLKIVYKSKLEERPPIMLAILVKLKEKRKKHGQKQKRKKERRRRRNFEQLGTSPGSRARGYIEGALATA